MIPACSVTLHMSLSPPDIKSSIVGFGFILLTLLIVNTSLYFTEIGTMATLTNYCLVAGAVVLNFFTISINLLYFR